MVIEQFGRAAGEIPPLRHVHHKEMGTRTMSTRRVVDWRIEPGEGDTHTLYLRNRPVLQDASMTQINKHLRKHHRAGETVHDVAEDGYVTDMTRRVERRQPAQRVSPLRRRHKAVRMPLLRF